jgi:hypothetical protein
MKKLSYTAPVVEITKWQTEDVITTSGGLVKAGTDVVASVGDSNVTRSISYGDLK